MKFKLKKKSKFTIKDQNRVGWYYVKTKKFSWKDTKALYNNRGDLLYKIEKKNTSLHDERVVVSPHSKTHGLVMRRKSMRFGHGRSVVQVWRGRRATGRPSMICRGNKRRIRFKIEEVSTRRRLATVKWKVLSAKQLIGGATKYVVYVSPGVDAALMIMLGIGLDGIYSTPILDELTEEALEVALLG